MICPIVLSMANSLPTICWTVRALAGDSTMMSFLGWVGWGWDEVPVRGRADFAAFWDFRCRPNGITSYRKVGVILPHLAEGQATVSVARLFHVKHFRLTAR